MEQPPFCKECGWVEVAHGEGLPESERPVFAFLVKPVCNEFVPPTSEEEND